jgi:hypothetical protein
MPLLPSLNLQSLRKAVGEIRVAAMMVAKKLTTTPTAEADASLDTFDRGPVCSLVSWRALILCRFGACSTWNAPE